MATADEYAAWIVSNADKKGTPEFDTVAQAYQQAKSVPAATTPSTVTPLSTGQRIATGAAKGMMGGGIGAIIGAGMAATDVGQEGLNKLAYDAGGKVTDVTGSPALGFAANVVTQAAPAVIGGKIAGVLASPAMEAGANRLMQSALKPTLADLKTGKAATAIQTLLDEGINATSGGVMKLKSKIADLNDEITSAISSSTARVDKNAVWPALKAQLEKFRQQVNPEADLAAIRKSWDEFITQGGTNISVQEAQKLKQGTYRILEKKYGQLGTADTEAQKALARGLKDEIAASVPGVSRLNAEESKLITTLNVTERRALMDANKNPMGLALLAHNPVSWAAFMADKSALFKSLVARMMNAGSERIPQAVIGTGIAASEGLIPQPQPALLNPQR